MNIQISTVSRADSFALRRGILLTFWLDDNIANCMIEQTPSDHGESESDVVLVRRILLRARLPPEILAIAFNILSSSRQHPSIQSMSSSQMPLDLHVIGALALATAYAEDHPYSFKYWSCYISDKRWRGRRINEVAMNMLAALDWRLHHLATPEAVAETMHLFQSRPAVEVLLEPHTVLGYFDLENTAALKLAVNTALCVNGLGTVWQCGLVTPETTPTSIGVADRDGAFLRLL